MKLVFKGKYISEDQLTKSCLPSNSVKFTEPETPQELGKTASLFGIPSIFLIVLFVLVSSFLHTQIPLDIRSPYLLLGVILTLLILLPHELLHAAAFGKNALVELYIVPKQLMAFVHSTQPVSKRRFIFLSLLPNVVFGWFPLALWTILPYHEVCSNILFTFSIFSILMGVGDYLNVYNALRQMPKGSMQQLSGFNSYWYMP